MNRSTRLLTIAALALLFRPTLAAAATLNAPAGLIATATSGSAISLRWTDTNSNEVSTAIERSLNGTSGFTQIGTVAANVTTYSSTGLSSGVRYYYRVRALGNGNSVSPYSSVVYATTLDTIPPSTPSSLTVTAAGCNQANVSWSASIDTGGSGLKGYNLYRNGVYVKQIPAPTTSTTDTGLTGSTTYNYTVAAVDYTGNQSGQTLAKSVTTPACGGGADTTPPSVPTSVSLTPVGCTQMNISWPASTDTGGSGLRGYNLYGWRNSTWTFLKQVLAPATSTSDTGLSPTTTYFYAVSAFDAAGNTSALSNYGSGATGSCSTTTLATTSTTTSTTTPTTSSSTSTTKPPTTTTTTSTATTTTTPLLDTTPPSVPTGLSATPASCSQINVAWNASSDTGSGVKAYNVYRGGAFLKQVLAPTTSTSDVGLAASTVYSYAVLAVDNAGNLSGLSATASTNTSACADTTPPAVPTGLSATSAGCSQINLTWNASTDTGGSGLKGYNLYRNGAYLKQVLAPATSSADTGLAASTTYSYTAQAVDNAGNVSAVSAASSAATLACAPPLNNAQLAGFVPGVGTPYDVVVNGTLAYVASKEFGLSVVNVANPGAPTAVGGANPPFEGFHVGVSGNLAAVDAGVTGFRIVDVSTPSDPTTVGSLSTTTLGGTSVGAAISGTTAYALVSVAGNPGHTDLVTINVATPSAPTIVGRVSLTAGSDIEVVGSYAYVVGGTAGFMVVNVANPSAPALVRTVDTPGTATGVTVSGNYAYVADTTSVRVMSIANPGQASEVGSLGVSALALAAWSNRLYTTDGGSFRVIDITLPTAPVLLSTSNSYGAQGIDANGTVAYLASPNIMATQGGFYVWNCAVPAAPLIYSNINDAFGNAGVAVSGTLAAAAGGVHGLKIVNISNPAAPWTASAISTTALGGTVTGAGMAGQTAYALVSVAGNPGHTDVVVLNVASPSSPAIQGRVSLSGGQSIRVVGSLAYVAAGTAGLQVVSVASPTAPAFLGSVDTPGTATDLVVSGSYAYVADTSSVQVINVATPSRPTIATSVATTATAVALAGNRLYAVDGGQFKIIDVTSPTAPSLLSSTNGYGAVGVAAVGTTAYLSTPALLHSDLNGGVRVVDASSPTAPRVLQQITVPGTIHMLATDATYLYASDYSGVVDVIQR